MSRNIPAVITFHKIKSSKKGYLPSSAYRKMVDVVDMYATMNCTADFRACTLPKKVDKISLITTRRINNVDDIDGAHPTEKRIFSKPNFTDNRDIEGSVPKLLHHGRNCQDMTLYVGK